LKFYVKKSIWEMWFNDKIVWLVWIWSFIRRSVILYSVMCTLVYDFLSEIILNLLNLQSHIENMIFVMKVEWRFYSGNGYKIASFWWCYNDLTLWQICVKRNHNSLFFSIVEKFHDITPYVYISRPRVL